MATPEPAPTRAHVADEPCSVEGCNQRATRRCDACRKRVCGRHGEEVAGLDLCFSCAIGMKDGMEMMKGWD